MGMPKTNALTPDMKSQLNQGTKIRFKWWRNNDIIYIGRIEKLNDALYYVPEHCFENEHLYNSMKYYNPLHTFESFTEFEILKI